MKAYVITIRGNINSVQAANKCIDSGKLHGVQIEKFSAITPADNPVELLQTRGIAAIQFDEKYSRNLKIVSSAFLSHYALWEACSKGTDEVFAIFEHDAIMVDSLPPAGTVWGH